jgi:hypothetical protein
MGFPSAFRGGGSGDHWSVMPCGTRTESAVMTRQPMFPVRYGEMGERSSVSMTWLSSWSRRTHPRSAGALHVPLWATGPRAALNPRDRRFDRRRA